MSDCFHRSRLHVVSCSAHTGRTCRVTQCHVTNGSGRKIHHLVNITGCSSSCPWARDLLGIIQEVYYSISQEYAHGFVVLCFAVVMQSFIMNSHEVFIHIHQGCFAGTGAIVRLPQCQWSKPDGYGKISQCITTTKQKPCAYFLGYTVLRKTYHNPTLLLHLDLILNKI